MKGDYVILSGAVAMLAYCVTMLFLMWTKP